jgi:chromosome segregation ATPase
MSDKNLSQVQEIEVLKKKVTLLIKGLKEEKIITTKLKEENELLKYDLEEKKLLLKKTKEEYQELAESKISGDKLSLFFNSLENNEIIDAPDKEKFNLKKDNEKLLNKINEIEKEKEELLEKIKSKDSQITTLNEEIISLKNQLLNYKDSIEESQEKRSKLLNNIKYEKLISNDKESKIVKLEQENKNLLSNNNSLKNQNEYLLQIIEKLKNQIEDKGKEFFYLEKEYDENKEIKIDNHTFKGYINKMSKWLIIDLNKINRNISIFFGKKPLKVSFSINGLDFDVDIDNILKMDYYHENKNKIKFIIDGKGKEDIKKAVNYPKNNSDDENSNAIFVGSFTEKECRYLIKFFKEMKNKFEEKSGIFINPTLGVGYLD